MRKRVYLGRGRIPAEWEGGDAEDLGRRVVFLHLVLTCGRSEWRMKMRFVGRGIVPVHR